MGKIRHEAQQRARPINEQCVRHERGRNIIYGTKQIEIVSYNLTSIAWVKGRAEVAISMSRGVIYGRGQNREPVLQCEQRSVGERSGRASRIVTTRG